MNDTIVRSVAPEPVARSLTPLEQLVQHILERGTQYGDGTRLVVDVPVRTTLGTLIEGARDRFNLDAFDGLVWIHSQSHRTTYSASQMDAARWLYVLSSL